MAAQAGAWLGAITEQRQREAAVAVGAGTMAWCAYRAYRGACVAAADDAAVYGVDISLIGGPFEGIDKWLGGELGADGNIYGVPGSAKSVVKVDPRTDIVTEVGDVRGKDYPSSIKGGKFKWLRGARARNGDMFGIPSNGNNVLRISKTGEIDTIGDPNELKGHWKWHGGVLAANGNLYGCPCNSDRVLKIDPASGKVTQVAGPFPGPRISTPCVCLSLYRYTNQPLIALDIAGRQTEVVRVAHRQGWLYVLHPKLRLERAQI
jgi:hypothetical protein